MEPKAHWENLYKTKNLAEASWYQPTPGVSLDFFSDLVIPTSAAIIDVGGGDSYLVDHLLRLGYTDITVLDISETAIQKAKLRLGKNSEKVNWVVADITEFSTDKKFDCWHDRATFHFLTRQEEIAKYLSVAQKQITDEGKMIIGTFSVSGPDKCSGLPVKQYSEQSLSAIIKKWFYKIKCITIDHLTPANKHQNFLFCSFQKIKY